MKVDKEHLKKLSKLCRIKCNDEELDSIEVSFKEIIAHFEEIKEVATQETPTCDRVTENVKCPQREDETGETLKRERFLANSPSHVGGMIRVPPVIKF